MSVACAGFYDHIPAAELARALHPPDSRLRLMAVIKFQCDVSGKDPQRDVVMVAAGYYLAERKWGLFDRHWSMALSEANVGCFHANKFFSFQGDFKGWDEDIPKHNYFARKFAAIAEKKAGIGLGTGTPIAAFNEILGPVLKKVKTQHNRFTPMMQCVLTLLARVAELARGQGERVAVVIEQGDGVGEVINHVTWLRDKKKQRWLDPIVAITPGDKRMYPLQAADYLAHELWREGKAIVMGQTREQARKSLQRLTMTEKVEFTIDTVDDLRRKSPLIEEYLKYRPGGW